MFWFSVQWKIILVRFNFVKLVLFFILLMPVIVHVFNVAFSFTIFFNLFCLLDGKGRVLTIFLTFSISC